MVSVNSMEDKKEKRFCKKQQYNVESHMKIERNEHSENNLHVMMGKLRTKNKLEDKLKSIYLLSYSI